jgi:hypothetical protein
VTAAEAVAAVEVAMAHEHTCDGPCGGTYQCTVMCCRDQKVKMCLACKQRGALPGAPR